MMKFVVPADRRVKLIENEKRDKYLELAPELKKKKQQLWNMKVTVMPIVIGGLGTIALERLGNKRTSGDHPDHSIINIGQNTEKSSRYLKRFAVTQMPLKKHQLMLVWKTLKEIIIIIKERIDKTQQNSKCRRCSDRDEAINHIISECSKLAQKEYKAKHDWVGKVIHWEMCKKFEFGHANKWNMHSP